MLLHQLQSASFRGVPFLVPHDQIDEGRHVVVHEYPDSNQRYAEDNGRDTPKFTISAIVAEPGLPGKLARLRRALAQEGPGTLKHPWCGAQFVQVDNVRIKRSDKHGGYVELEIKFLVTGPPQFPALVSGIPAAVSALASSAIIEIFAQFVAEYGDPLSTGAVAASPLQSVAGLVNALSATSIAVVTDELALIADTVVETIGSASAAATVFRDDVGRFATDPPAMAEILTTALRAPLTTDASIETRQLIGHYAAIFNAAAAIAGRAAAIAPTTLDLSNRATALAILSGYVQAAAFVNLAESVAVSTYDTADDVERVEILLTESSEQLQKMSLSTTVRAALTNIYVAASEVLRDAAVRLPRIVTVPASATPASVLAYMLYQDSLEPQTAAIVESRVGMLVKLNLDQTPLLLIGSVSAVVRDA